jgi:hypothetical protein
VEAIKIRWLSAVYAPCFAFFSVLCVREDFGNGYPLGFVALSALFYGLMNAGNVVYALGAPAPALRKSWRILAPCFVLFFILEVVMDETYGKIAGPHPVSLPAALFVWSVALLFFAPAFHANLRLAQYGAGADTKKR